MKVLVQTPALPEGLPSTYRNGIYRDNVESAEPSASSSYSARSGGRYSEEDLPPYEETPLIPHGPAGEQNSSNPPPEPRRRWYHRPPPDLPFSKHDSNPTDVQTCFPDYSTDAETLRQMIYEQASYPPTYYLELKGTHTETTYRRGNSVSFHNHAGGHGTSYHRRRSSSWNMNGDTKSEKTITDFFIRINITHLLSPDPNLGGELKLLADNEKGYRGGIIKRFEPSVASPEIENQHEELKAWCDKYVSDPSSIKSFTLKREVSNHDTKKLESLLHSLVASANYRGQVSVHFPITHKRVRVYSPGKINKWRMTTWIRWFFYLTFLWIFSWLFLFLATARYEVVKVIFPYADATPEEENRGAERRPTVMSEAAWFQLWEKSIMRGVLGRLDCTHSEMDDEYRLATEAMAARDDMPSDAHRTGNIYQGGVIGLFGVGTQFSVQWQNREGWGYDC